MIYTMWCFAYNQNYDDNCIYEKNMQYASWEYEIVSSYYCGLVAEFLPAWQIQLTCLVSEWTIGIVTTDNCDEWLDG